MHPAIISILAFFGGAIFLAFVIFAYLLLNAVNKLNDNVDFVCSLLEPLMGDKSVKETMKKIGTLGEQVPYILDRIDLLIKVFTQFNKSIFAAGNPPTEELGPTPIGMPRGTPPATPPASPATASALASEGRFFGYTEEDAAVVETQDQLRKQGVETNKDFAPPVTMAKVVEADTDDGA